ncbi:P63C domain-containing protein [Agrobacterium pusense]|uniref:P63C domain-containing protein n=1 Tax=Agrobacterium pusense TaxID=648995 RepID=UPI0010AE4BDD|nr:P63C domain-containing protein [Agrobacterium pusense]WCK26608.1 P63C domain-containing protein [Agrobacterium pusense]
MNRADSVISRFCSQSALAEALSVRQSTVQYWSSKGKIPEKWHDKIVQAGLSVGLHITKIELGGREASPSDDEASPAIDVAHEDVLPPLPNSPFAKWKGQIDLGGDLLDCYVLDTGQRVIALRSAIKSFAGIESGNLGNYIGVSGLKPFINSDLILGELSEFSIPGTQFRGNGMTTEHFELICRGYVQALYQNAPLTDRQREIAIKCAVLTSGLTRTGLDALIDEATGYQYEREEDALQVKLRAFIAEELRAWEKTFPDELWEEFGRLTNWQGSLKSRPKYWGKLVIELVYDTLDPDVAKYLRDNRPPANVRWHQNLTENLGVRQLVSRCFEIVGLAKSCRTMAELRKKVAHHYGKQSMLFNVYED